MEFNMSSDIASRDFSIFPLYENIETINIYIIHLQWGKCARIRPPSMLDNSTTCDSERLAATISSLVPEMRNITMLSTPDLI